MKHRNKLLRIAFLFGILIVTIGTVSGQLLIHPNCKAIHYTDEQDMRCLECLLNFSERDSLLQRLFVNDMECDSIIGWSNEQKSIVTIQLSKKTKQLNRANLKLKISGNLVKFGIPGGVILGFFLHSAIIKN